MERSAAVVSSVVRGCADDRTVRDGVDEIIHLAHPEFTPGYIASAMGRVP
jgi:hypothetical protein